MTSITYPEQASRAVEMWKAMDRRIRNFRARFIEEYKVNPSVMYVGRQVYELGFPAAHTYPVKFWAVEDMCVVQKPECPPLVMAIIKPPEAKKARVFKEVSRCTMVPSN